MFDSCPREVFRNASGRLLAPSIHPYVYIPEREGRSGAPVWRAGRSRLPSAWMGRTTLARQRNAAPAAAAPAVATPVVRSLNCLPCHVFDRVLRWSVFVSCSLPPALAVRLKGFSAGYFSFRDHLDGGWRRSSLRLQPLQRQLFMFSAFRPAATFLQPLPRAFAICVLKKNGFLLYYLFFSRRTGFMMIVETVIA